MKQFYVFRSSGMSFAVPFLLAAALANAQTPGAVLTLGIGSGLPGQSVALPLALANNGAAAITAVTIDATFDPTQLAYQSVQAGGAASAAGKAVSASSPSPGIVRIVVFGLNQAAIADGELAVISFGISSSALSSGTNPLALANVSAADSSAGAVSVTLQSGSITVSVPSTPPPAPAPAPSPTPTPTPPPFPTQRFQIGDRVMTTDRLKIRETPAGRRLGSQLKGAKGTVIEGPLVANGYNWWNVNYDSGVDGWSAENWLEKAPAVLSATTTPEVEEQINSLRQQIELLQQRLSTLRLSQ
jgi:hypothetical protein